VVWFWIDYPGDTGFMKARHTAVVEIKKALEKADILIPFPIRTLDFGAKGGEKLNTMLSKTKSEETSEETSEEKAEEKSADSQKSSSSENEK
jgi:small-conductance mechanosensitive channel